MYQLLIISPLPFHPPWLMIISLLILDAPIILITIILKIITIIFIVNAGSTNNHHDIAPDTNKNIIRSDDNNNTITTSNHHQDISNITTHTLLTSYFLNPTASYSAFPHSSSLNHITTPSDQLSFRTKLTVNYCYEVKWT